MTPLDGYVEAQRITADLQTRFPAVRITVVAPLWPDDVIGVSCAQAFQTPDGGLDELARVVTFTAATIDRYTPDDLEREIVTNLTEFLL
jgi:hypothetical protein